MTRISALPSRRFRSGFTLVELMIVVAIIGVLAAIAIPAFSRYVKKSRTGEAVSSLNKIWAGSLVYYETDHAAPDGSSLPKQFPRNWVAGTDDEYTGECGCLPSGKCPGNSPVYTNSDLYRALNFSYPDAHLYEPFYQSGGFGTNAAFMAQMAGDQDCDGIFSIFQRRGDIDPVTGDVTGSQQPYVVNELE